MAETGQVTLYGDHPTLTECSLYRARQHIYKEERYKFYSDSTGALISLIPHWLFGFQQIHPDYTVNIVYVCIARGWKSKHQ